MLFLKNFNKIDKKLFIYIFFSFLLFSCSSKKQTVYLNDIEISDKSFNKNILNSSYLENKIEIGDILKIEVKSLVPEASIPYNISVKNSSLNTIELIRLQGYLVDNSGFINFPVLGLIKADSLNLFDLQHKITSLLLAGNHLINPSVQIRRLNSKFTILGEVRNPGTFNYFDEKLNLFQALGYAGDLTIDGKRKNISLIREVNGIRSVYKIKITSSDFLKTSTYYIKNNDIIIVNPTFSKIKSAGFIGSASSISSIASLILSITLLIINK
ncbi:MAG: ligand-binding protein [Pelagibacterales bacterium]|nr:ligand-binding protein [Pelagibacterales bacterium]